MKPPVFSTSMSIHKIFRSSQNHVLREWKRQLPTIRPCYALSNRSTQQTISLMREYRIPMLCETLGQVSAVNEYTLTIENTRFGENEYIARKLSDMPTIESAAPLWIYTKISADGIENSRRMFEHIWAHKNILRGFVFNIDNFTDSARGSIPPSIYSYKVAIDYMVRNMTRPFESGYGIQTPCIMLDGRRVITRIKHLEELKMNIEPVISSSKDTEFQLIVDDLFDHNEK
jgi:hypothetical protein